MFYFRCIKDPFKNGLSAKVHAVLTLVIYILSTAVGIPYFYYWSYHVSPNNNLHVCRPMLVGEATFIYHCALVILATILPLILIAIVQFKSYRALKISSGRFGENSNRMKRMKRVFFTLLATVVAFFICTIPNAVFKVYGNYLIAYNMPFFLLNMKLMTTVNTIVKLIFSCNNCLNPIIYARIHTVVAEKVSKIFSSGLRLLNKSRTTTSESTTASTGI